MKLNSAFPLLGILAAGSSLAMAQQISPDRISDRIRSLASDELEGRLVGTRGGQRAQELVARQMAAAGLVPGGDGHSWFQSVSLSRLTPGDPPRILFSFGGEQTALVQGRDISVSTRNPDGRLEVERAPIVFVGYGISAPERGWDDLQGVDLRGRVVLYLNGEPDDDQADGPFMGRRASYYGLAEYKRRSFLTRGAVGALSISGSPRGTGIWSNARPAAAPYFVRAAPGPRLGLIGSVASDAADDLLRRSGRSLASLQAAAGRHGFRALPLERARLSVRYSAASQPVRAANVVGLLRGAGRAREAVIVSAHLDHLGVDPQGQGPDRIYNGAWDNASGVAGMLELAVSLRDAPQPARTIVFLATTAEEQGILGSRHFVGNSDFAPKRIVANINIDPLSFIGRSTDFQLFGYGRSTLDELFAEQASKMGRRLAGDLFDREGFYFRSDQIAFAEAGIPSVYLFGGLDLRDGGLPAGREAFGRLRNRRYHQLGDEWSSDIDLSGAVEDLELARSVILQLVNSGMWPTWHRNSEFCDRSSLVRAAVRAARCPRPGRHAYLHVSTSAIKLPSPAR